MCRKRKLLSELVGERMRRFPASGEINRTIADPAAALARVEARYAPAALLLDRTDGLSLEFADWRFNLRLSNTEPVVRLNVESRGDQALMRARTDELLRLLDDLNKESRTVADMTRPAPAKILVTGAAGFIGMHVCQRLLARGDAGDRPRQSQRLL